MRKKYYYFKQYGFNGTNLFHVININTLNSAALILSGGCYHVNKWSCRSQLDGGSLFFSTLENYIPNTMPRIKMAVTGTKFVVAFPIRFVECTTNTGFGFLENLIIGTSLPTNITEIYRLNEGPKLKNITSFKEPRLDWLIVQLTKLRGKK